MSNILNTLQLSCGKCAEEAPRYADMENAGYEIETALAFSNKHVFHSIGHYNRSVGVKTFEQVMAMIEAGADVRCSGLTITSNQEHMPAIRVTDQPEHLIGYVMRGADLKTGTGRGY